MEIVVWALAACALLGMAAWLASMIDRRAGWNQVSLELDSSLDLEAYESEQRAAHPG
jgi:hypothetical protein